MTQQGTGWVAKQTQFIEEKNWSRLLDTAKQALAEATQEESSDIKANIAFGLYNVALTKLDKRQPKEAYKLLKQANDYSPAQSYINCELGNLYSNVGEFESAMHYFARMVAFDPDNLLGFVNLAYVYHRLGLHEQEEFLTQHILEKDPDHVTANWHDALWTLLKGELELGWKKYEWRLKHELFIKNNRSGLPLDDKFYKKIWKGESLKNKTLMVFPEQGYGDFIQFARYLPLVKKECKHLIVMTSKACYELADNMDCIDTLIKVGDPLPKYDKHIFLLSLPSLFKTTMDTIPNEVPYFKVPEAIQEKWQKKIKPSSNLKVGLCCAGNPNTVVSIIRTCTLTNMAPILNTEGIDFYSLHVRDKPRDLYLVKNLIDVTDDIKSFIDSAALINSLDLVITVETAVAHLAGALNKPVWILLAKTPAWRWLLDRSDSPWYPSAKLFRQAQDKDWSQPVQELTQALQELLSHRP